MGLASENPLNLRGFFRSGGLTQVVCGCCAAGGSEEPAWSMVFRARVLVFVRTRFQPSGCFINESHAVRAMPLPGNFQEKDLRTFPEVFKDPAPALCGPSPA
jgi:hypothetical protein